MLRGEIDRLPEIASQQGGAARLVERLSEDSDHFSGLSVEEADWLRGHIYAAIALSDSPSECLVRAREDLRTSSSHYVLAGIARVLRAAKTGPEWTEDLQEARRRIQLFDEFADFRFDPPQTPCCSTRTSLQELDATLEGLSKSCCESSNTAPSEHAEFMGMTPTSLYSAHLEDQDGVGVTFNSLAPEKPIVLTLFYTRCMNSLKCSLTISRLAQLAQIEPGFACIGMSYDPEYDTPSRLSAYGNDRAFPFGDDARLVRVCEQWNEIRVELGLQAGYGASTVNAHAREVFLIAPDRRHWRIPPDWLSKSDNFSSLFSEAISL